MKNLLQNYVVDVLQKLHNTIIKLHNSHFNMEQEFFLLLNFTNV
jgi:hypothetical protein